MRYEVAKALAVGLIALAAPPAMARPATVATPAPPTDRPTDAPPDTEPGTPTDTDTPTDTETPTGTDTPAPQVTRPCLYGPDEGEVDTRPVPGVVGMTRANAAAALAGGPFKTKAEPSDAADDWIVRRQVPRGGRDALCGSTVTLYLRPVTPDEPARDPDVVGPSETDDLSSTGPLVWLVPTVAVAAGAAATVWAVRRTRRRPRPALAGSLVCVPCADPSAGVRVRDLAPTVGVTFVCYHDQGRQEIRETVR